MKILPFNRQKEVIGDARPRHHAAKRACSQVFHQVEEVDFVPPPVQQ